MAGFLFRAWYSPNFSKFKIPSYPLTLEEFWNSKHGITFTDIEHWMLYKRQCRIDTRKFSDLIYNWRLYISFNYIITSLHISISLKMYLCSWENRPLGLQKGLINIHICRTRFGWWWWCWCRMLAPLINPLSPLLGPC